MKNKKNQKKSKKLGFFKVFFDKMNKIIEKLLKKEIIVIKPMSENKESMPESGKIKPKIGKVGKIKPKIRVLMFINKIKIINTKILNSVKAWYSKRKILIAVNELIGKILLDGLLISIPYWYFVEYNIITIPAFGSALIVLKKQLIPIVLQLLNSFSLVRVNK